MNYKIIRVTLETHKRLKNYGKKKETFDEIITRLLDIAEGDEAK